MFNHRFSGKSSIVMLLLGFMTYTGRITIDGVDISQVHRRKLRDAITTITQENLDLDGTVRDNLYPWARVSSRHEYKLNPLAIDGLLDRLGLLHILGAEKLDSQMSKLGLSHGQMQLMGIARSCFRHLSNNTRIIVMDEATSSLDQDTEEMVLQVFKEIFSDCTILTVAHRTETLQRSTLILKVADGKVSVNNRPGSSQGTVEEASSNMAQPMGFELPPSHLRRTKPAQLPREYIDAADIDTNEVPFPIAPQVQFPGLSTSSNISAMDPTAYPRRNDASLPRTPSQASPESPTQFPRPTEPVPTNPIFNFWLQQSEMSRRENKEYIARAQLVRRTRMHIARTREQFRLEREAAERAKEKAKAKAEAKQTRKRGQKKAQTGESSGAGTREAKSKPKMIPVQTEAGESVSAGARKSNEDSASSEVKDKTEAK